MAARRLTPPVSAARARGSPRSWGSLRDEPQEASPAVLHFQQPKKKRKKNSKHGGIMWNYSSYNS